MRYHLTRKWGRCSAMTLIEVIVAMAIMVVVLAAVVPQIRAIQNSWASKRENTEVIQNSRVLVDHIVSSLSQAKKITAVSNSSQTNGYIEFGDNDGNTMRYQINAGDNYVVFGPVGSLSELAGPVSQLQFTCYDACDLDTPIMDVNEIRAVKIQTTFTNSAELGRDQSFIGRAYLRTNATFGADQDLTVTEEPSSEFEFDSFNGETSELCQIDTRNYLCAYGGPGDDGWAVILTVNTSNWTIGSGTPLEYDTTKGIYPALGQINATDYLCAYQGNHDYGVAVILTVNTGTKTITQGTPFVFDSDKGKTPALSQISPTDYLCAYSGDHDWGTAVVLVVNTVTKTVTKGTPFIYDTSKGKMPALSKIDDTHFLCTYGGNGDDGWAVVLTVDPATRTISKGTAFEFDTVQLANCDLRQIDQNHYLCVYEGGGALGYAVVLTVNPATWAIGKGATVELDTHQAHAPVICRINESRFLCAHGDFSEDGIARILQVDTQTDSVSCGPAYMHDPVKGKWPVLCGVDTSHFLCAYTGNADDGYATVLTADATIMP